MLLANHNPKPGHIGNALTSSFFALATVAIVSLAGAASTPALAADGLVALPTTSLAELLAMRQTWGKRPSKLASTEVTSSGGQSYALLPTTSVADLVAAREVWGSGPATSANVSATEPGYAILPTTSVADLVKMREAWGLGKVVTSVAKAAPASQSGASTDQALAELLAERASWGTEPTLVIGAPKLAGFDVLPTTSVSELVKMRESWGLGHKHRPVKAPLAAGARSPLPKVKLAALASDSRADTPIVHVAESAPPVAPAPISAKELETALASFLAERATWGDAPSARVAAVAPVDTAATAGGASETASCETRLRQAAMSGSILFEAESAIIDARSNATLDALADVAKSCGVGRIRVEGHTDSSGRARRNQELSSRRAAAVASYLRKAGVKKGRVVAVGMGELKPIAPNDTAEGRARNRRIEFSIVK